MSVTIRSDGARRIDVGAARDVFLQDVVLDRARQRRGGDALPLRDRDVERQQDDRRRVDRHRRRHAIERDAVEQRRHVLDRIDRDADAADFAGGQRMVRVVAHLRRQIEGDAQAADALREQIPVARVGFRRRAEAGVLPHRPQPAAVHGRLDAAGERETRRDSRARLAGSQSGEIVGRARREVALRRRRRRIVARFATDAVACKCLTDWRLGLRLNLPTESFPTQMNTSGARSLSTALV